MVRKMIFGSTTTASAPPSTLPTSSVSSCNKIQTKLTTNGEIKFEIVGAQGQNPRPPLHYECKQPNWKLWLEGRPEKNASNQSSSNHPKKSPTRTAKQGQIKSESCIGLSDQSYRETSTTFLNPTSTPAGERSESQLTGSRLHYPKDSIAGPEQD